MRDRLALPDFLWLLRDVDTIPVAAADSPTHYVRQILKKNKSCGLGSILEFFPSFHCLTIPPPSADNAILADITNNLDNLSVHFNSGVATAVEHMLNTIRVKVGYGGSNIKCDGSMLACIIEQYFTIINQPDSVIPTFQASWLMAVELKLRRVSESLVSEYERDMRAELEGKLPLREGKDGERGETLMNIHLQVFARKRLQFQDAILSFLSQSHYASTKLTDLESGLIAAFDRSITGYDCSMPVVSNGNISGTLLNFIQENIKFSQEFCTSLYHEKYREIVNVKLQNSLSTQIPVSIDEELCTLSSQYHDEARGPAAESVYQQLRSESSVLEAELLLIPGPVTKLHFSGIASNRVKLKWELPDINPQAAEKYIVCIRTKGKNWMVVGIRRACSVVITGLKPKKRYCFAVLASNKKYTGMQFSHRSIETKISGAVAAVLTVSAVAAAPGLLFLTGGFTGAVLITSALLTILSYGTTVGAPTGDSSEEVKYLGGSDSEEIALENFEDHDDFTDVESEEVDNNFIP